MSTMEKMENMTTLMLRQQEQNARLMEENRQLWERIYVVIPAMTDEKLAELERLRKLRRQRMSEESVPSAIGNTTLFLYRP